MPATVNPIAAMALLLGAFGGMMAGLLACRRRWRLHPEVVRKLLHVGMGLAALSLPWLFEHAWPVIALTGVFVLLLIALRVLPILRVHFGSVIHGVERKSPGEIYFALGVGALFLCSLDDPLLFSIPMLILTLADAAAGLTGLYYGRLHYAAAAEEKSIEGSSAFFMTAFLITQTALLLFTEIGRVETLLIALTAGLSLTLLEAVAGNGLDNLLIPLAAFLLLKTCLDMDAPELAACFGVSLVLTVFMLFWLRRRFAGRADSRLSVLRPSRGPAHSM